MPTTDTNLPRTGGPAFPSPTANPIQNGQLSVRDYFAAHAPRKPACWFTPTIAPKPKPIYDHVHPTENCFDCSIENYEERQEWEREYSRQLALQWPYAYADAMLAERAK